MLRISTRFALTLATLLFGLLFVTPAALAQGQDCPPEPASNTPIDDGEVFAGPNCTLQSREMSTPSFSPHIAGKHFTWLWR